MFYRFLSKLATQERLEAFPVPRPGSDNNERWGVGWAHFEDKFESVPAEFNQPGVKFFRAPSIKNRPVGVCIRFHQGKEKEVLPDVWGVAGKLFISERVKSIIESNDTMAHEYFSAQLIDWKERPFAKEQPYYWFVQRRFLTITPSNRIAEADELGFYPVPYGEDFIARVKDSPRLREQLGQVPLWQHCAADTEKRSMKERSILYLSQSLVDVLRREKITGIDLFSEKYGKGEQSLCAV
ncbi:Conserved hypothetical protein [gamma proteobacterium HdN1]|nr:Conserved hypothetical protein [gamma proteobacterium HdN1]